MPLHSSLGNKSKTSSKKEKNNNLFFFMVLGADWVQVGDFHSGTHAVAVAGAGVITEPSSLSHLATDVGYHLKPMLGLLIGRSKCGLSL